MKKQDTAAFSLIRCDTEKKMPALAVRAIRAALFFAGLLAVAQGAAGIWTNYGWRAKHSAMSCRARSIC